MAHLWQRPFGDTVPEDKPASEDRLIMLCDGVFAIAITLLVLDIRLPDGLKPDQFPEQLPDLLFKILFYFITFLVIAGYWIMHRRIMHQVRRLDRNFIWLTFLFLSFVALFPVMMTLLTGYGQYREAVIIYTLTLAACGFSSSFLWIYASRNHRLIDPNIDQELIRFRTIATLIIPTYYTLSLLLLFVIPGHPSNIFYSWVFIGFPIRLVRSIYRRRLARREQLADGSHAEPSDRDDEPPSAPLTEKKSMAEEKPAAGEKATAES